MTADETRPPLNGRAVRSALLGALAFAALFLVPFVAMVLSVPAITLAIAARREVLASDGTQRGFDLAGAGLAAGSATVLLAIVAQVIDVFDLF